MSESPAPSPGPQHWFITGCSGGLGLALARAVLAAGHSVTGTVRRAGDAAELESHPQGRVMVLDVTRTEDVRETVHRAWHQGSGIDVIVNNAGAGWLGALEDCTTSDIRACMEVNFHGPLEVMRAAAPLFRERGRGRLLNVSAAAAIANYPGFAIYGAAKAALEAASESYRTELAPFGIAVTLVQPGPFRTGFIGRSLHRTAVSSPGYDNTVGRFASLLAKMDGRQPGDPDKAAAAIIRMVRENRAPLRLVLGAYALKKARDTAAARVRELDACADLSSSTEFVA